MASATLESKFREAARKRKADEKRAKRQERREAKRQTKKTGEA